MNSRELEKLRVMYDEDNECWAITNTTYIVADEDLIWDLDIPHKTYFNLSISNGGYYLDNDENCVGFKTKEIAEQCLEVIKNYKENDIIEKVGGKNPIMRFKYLNWQGKTSIRNVNPIKLWYGNTNYHKENQWFMKAYDIDKCSERDFAMMDIIEYIKVEEC